MHCLSRQTDSHLPAGHCPLCQIEKGLGAQCVRVKRAVYNQCLPPSPPQSDIVYLSSSCLQSSKKPCHVKFPNQSGKNSIVSILLTPAHSHGDIRLRHVGPSLSLLIPHIVDFLGLQMAPRWLIVPLSVTPNYTYPIATIRP